MRGRFLALILLCSASPVAARDVCVSLTLNGRPVEAKIVAHQGGVCWLAEADGTYSAVRVRSVRSFKRLSRPVEPMGTLQLRAELRKEYGRNYHIEVGGRHLVVADRSIAGTAARRCDEVSRAFRSYFAKRSVPLKSTDYPMAVVIVRSQAEFQKKAAAEGVDADSTLMGYYMRTSNRVLLFDS